MLQVLLVLRQMLEQVLLWSRQIYCYCQLLIPRQNLLRPLNHPENP